MNKSEIIEKLTEVEKILNMSPEEYANYINNRFSEFRPIEPKDAYTHRPGYVKAEIKWILNN